MSVIGADQFARYVRRYVRGVNKETGEDMGYTFWSVYGAENVGRMTVTAILNHSKVDDGFSTDIGAIYAHAIQIFDDVGSNFPNADVTTMDVMAWIVMAHEFNLVVPGCDGSKGIASHLENFTNVCTEEVDDIKERKEADEDYDVTDQYADHARFQYEYWRDVSDLFDAMNTKAINNAYAAVMARDYVAALEALKKFCNDY